MDFRAEVFGKQIIKTQYAVALPDYCKAIRYSEKCIHRMISHNEDIYKPFYKKAVIKDSLGRWRPTVIISLGMAAMLTLFLGYTRIKDSTKKATIIDLQRKVMLHSRGSIFEKPRKTRSDKGDYRKTDDYRTIEFIHCQLPKLEKKEIARITGITYNKVLRWTRVA